MGATVLLARHATPDWSRTDIPYDVPPGPPLTPTGEAEAAALGAFFRERNVAAIYASPLERTLRTAEIAGTEAGIPVTVEESIAEWRRTEDESAVHARMDAFWAALVADARPDRPPALVTHGGPVAVLLRRLGMGDAELESYRRRFDRRNPLPPTGVWAATSLPDGWRLDLVFPPAIVDQAKVV